MPSTQGDSRNSKNIKGKTRGRRRGSWSMILLGMALLILAFLMFLYASQNFPKVSPRKEQLNIPTPSVTPSPAKTPEEKSGTRNSMLRHYSEIITG
jgi:hypothetical protein